MLIISVIRLAQKSTNMKQSEINDLITISYSLEKKLKAIIEQNSSFLGSKELLTRANFYLGTVQGMRSVLFCVENKNNTIDFNHVKRWISYYE